MASAFIPSAKLTFLASLFVSQLIQAEPEISEQVMQQIQAAQECMSKIDKSKLNELQTKGKTIEADLKTLCAAGKRDKAMSIAMNYSKEIHDNPQLTQMRKCSEMIEGMEPEYTMPPTAEEQENDGHVCDNM